MQRFNLLCRRRGSIPPLDVIQLRAFGVYLHNNSIPEPAMHPRHFFTVALPLLLAPSPALAQSAVGPPVGVGPDPSAWPPDRITVGLGGGIASDYSGSDDYAFQPGGIVQGSVLGFAFAMRGLNLYVDLARERQGAGNRLRRRPGRPTAARTHRRCQGRARSSAG